MNPWLLLALAIVAEVVGTSALMASDDYTRLVPSLVVVAGYVLSFYCLSLVLRHIPVGITQAVWSGLGIVLIPAAPPPAAHRRSAPPRHSRSAA